MPSPKVGPGGAGRRGQLESDYEEIGPPRYRAAGEPPSKQVSLTLYCSLLYCAGQCDLCGAPNAVVRCEGCGDQGFCAACDEM